ncbi:MAG: DUF4142 domain-containing protein [Gemmatimonadaceae bacterium]
MRISCALLMCAVAACTSQGSEAAERQADTAGRRDSIAAVAAASMSESQVIGLLEHTHAADSALGALGATNGSSSEVKDFGRMIMREHHALRRDAAALAQGLRIASEPPRAAPDAPPAEIRDSLDATPTGAQWNRKYVDYAIAMHSAAMENSARALAATRSPATKQFIEKSVPILQKHLDKAISLSRSLPMASRDPAASPTKP